MKIERARGVTLIEVLVTLVILAFGLLGIAAFQAKAQVGSIEAYQRAQAVVLLQDMRARLASNPLHAGDYVTATPLGTADAQPDDCSAAPTAGAKDLCEWSRALKGAALAAGATAGSASSAVIGARGCIEELQARDETSGVCKPGLYRVTVAWQGLHPTKAPAQACGQGKYGNDDTNRRAISVTVAIGVPRCG
ncbi:type IV pilus modification protein PilV [Massilia sp. LXY-6]|uniref:type IV pilus modification protein PilV n=1 Tax=Massilia sp. LXY-6 TaxID=3379823 RepID=UPI003EE3E7C9